jgi:hypothetical protein
MAILKNKSIYLRKIAKEAVGDEDPRVLSQILGGKCSEGVG